MMFDLRELLTEFAIDGHRTCPGGLTFTSITDDSRKASPGVLFVAIRGHQSDGHDFLPQAAAGGSSLALVENDVDSPPGMKTVLVGNARRALACIAGRVAGDPSRKLMVLGVTGTNGKTTVTYMLEAIFRAAGLEPGVMGTVNYRWCGHSIVASNTTPSPMAIADYLNRMHQDGVRAVAMEVSSHAISQHRVDGVYFRAAGFTNLTQDHLDYHTDMDDYRDAKGGLFTRVLPQNPGAEAIVNYDDPAGRHYAAQVRELGVNHLTTFSMQQQHTDLTVQSVDFSRDGFILKLTARGLPMEIKSQLHGMFNVENTLTAVSLAMAAGIAHEFIIKGLAALRGVPGRFEMVPAGQPFPVIVDYAHTPDSLEKLLVNARPLAPRRLICVFGAGGDRDPGKRPLMGRAAGRLADVAIVTNDNPRTEDPEKIAEAILCGVREAAHASLRLEKILDREQAIAMAVGLAAEGDAVVIAGKGHEDYQIIGTEKRHFDDREAALKALAPLGWRA